MLLDGDRPKDFSAVPILQYQGALQSRGCGSFSELLDEFYLRRDKAEAMRRRSQELTHQVRTLRDRTAKKLAIQRSDLLRCADREALRQKADLIKANLYRIHKGDRTVTVQDYYAEGCPDVTIELDPRKSPQENAAALYKSYRKAKTAEQHLTGLIAEASRNLDYLNSVLDELARAESERDLADIRAELRATGYLRQPRNAKKEKTAQRAPLSFVSSTGYEILVGRSNTQNDELTHRTARRTDIWLHVQKVHGSHVIIRAHDTTPDDQTIAEAASLAVYYSQARGGGKTPVDYTMARFVRKPSGALPGMVLYTDYQTCMAESDEALAEACACDKAAKSSPAGELFVFLLRYAAAILTVLAGWLTDAENCGMLLALFIVGIVHRKERLYLRRTDHEKTHCLLLPRGRELFFRGASRHRRRQHGAGGAAARRTHRCGAVSHRAEGAVFGQL